MRNAGRLLFGTVALVLLSSALWCRQALGQPSAGGLSLVSPASTPTPPTNTSSVVRPPGATVSWTMGRKGLLFIRARFADEVGDHITDGQAYTLMEQANQFLVENSYNSLWLLTTVTPYVTLPQPLARYTTFADLAKDAHAAAQAAGYNFLDYDLDIIHTASFGGYPPEGVSDMGSWTIGLFTGAENWRVARAILRTFTLGMANTWVTGNAPNKPNGFPSDPDSDIGHPALNAPGVDNTQEDPFDFMGAANVLSPGGANQLNPLEKYYLEWLPLEYMRVGVTNGTTRLFAFDTPALVPGRAYALRVPKDMLHEYWLDYRQLWTNNPWLANGVEVHWPAWPALVSLDSQDQTKPPIASLLLDSTPGTPGNFNDAALVVGRTLADTQVALYITPVAKGGTYPEQWIDVVVNQGLFPSNHPPSVTISASQLSVTNGATVTLSAAAVDPDGDKLAYYWSYSDQTFGSNAPVNVRTFSQDGQYVVRCEVSDMKGGLGSALLLITVGTPITSSITGVVIDNNGNPVAGVRVHNGAQQAGYRDCLTDSQGNYIISGLDAGPYSVGAFLYGYRTEPLDFVNPVTVAGAVVSFVDFLATAIPQLNVFLTNSVVSEGAQTAIFFSRTGSTNEALPVYFMLGGTAVCSAWTNDPAATNLVADYTFPGFDLGSNVNALTLCGAVIPAGVRVARLTLSALSDPLAEGPETVRLLLMAPTNLLKSEVEIVNDGTNSSVVTNLYEYLYPGWEIRTVNNQDVLFQTDPSYVIGPGSEATLVITDTKPPPTPAVNVLPGQVRDSGVPENGRHSAALLLVRSGNLGSPLQVRYSVGGTASNGVDYAWLPGTLAIPAGQAQASLYIDPIDDMFVEGTETVVITVLGDSSSSPLYVAGSTNTITVNLIDDDLPLVTVYSKAPLAAETGLTPGSVTFARSGDLSRDLLVYYLVEGTAQAGVNYQALPGTVVIPAGQVTATVLVTPIADGLPTGDLTASVFVSSSPTYNIGAPNTATVTIQDAEMPSINVVVTVAVAAEGGAPGTMDLVRSGSTTNDLTVYIDVGGTALPVFDYATISTNVYFAAGAANATITITAITDLYREPDKTVLIEVLPGPNYNLGTNISGKVTVADNNSTNLPVVSFPNRSGSVFAASGTNRLEVDISAAPADTNSTVYIGYRVLGGNASTNDYRLLETNSLPYGPAGAHFLTFNTTNGLAQFIPMMLLTNKVDPQPSKLLILELFYGALTNIVMVPTNTPVITTNPPVPPDTNSVLVTNMIPVTNWVVQFLPTNAFIGPYRTYSLSIVDQKAGGGGIVSIVATNPVASEEGLIPGAFTISRTGATNIPLTVSFAVGGTAARRNNYADLGNAVTIPAGATAVLLPVLPVDDPTEELAETVVVTLTGAPGNQISPSNYTATVTIGDNDGTIQFLKSEFTVAEGATNVFIPVVRTGATNRAVWVDYLVNDGTARRDVDYTATNGTLYFAPGQVGTNIYIGIIDNLQVEPNRMLSLALTNAIGGFPLGGQSTATLTIQDDDTSYSFVTLTNRVNENTSNAVITVVRYGILSFSNSVQFTATNGTAVDGVDFTAITNYPVSFNPGETSKTVRVTILDNTVFDGNRTVNLHLTDPSDLTSLGSNVVATLVIVDDECALSFGAPKYVTNEFSPYALLQVVRTGGTVNAVSVDYATTNGTAVSPRDYDGQKATLSFGGDSYRLATNGSGLLEFVPGETNKTIRIALHDNTVAEGDHSFYVWLAKPRTTLTNVAPAGATVPGAITNAEVRIFDNEQPGWIAYEFYIGEGANGPVRALSLQYDQSIVLGGDFTTFDGVTLPHVARLKGDGVLDTSFNVGLGADGPVLALASLPDGKVLIGGAFTNVGGVAHPGLAQLNGNGSLDTAFNPPAPTNGVVRALAIQSTGKIIVGGDFTRINGQDHQRLARYNADGTLDAAFRPSFAKAVYALALQSDDRVIVGGAFSNGVARLNADGSPDPTFYPGSGADGTVLALAIQTDGQILVGGAFGQFNGFSCGRVARLTTGGAVDTLFDPGLGADGNVNAIAISPSGKIMLGGAFTHINGLTRHHFARLKRYGQVDELFDPHDGANDIVRAAVSPADGALLIGGDFTTVSGVPRNHIARVHGDELLNITSVEFSTPLYYADEGAGEATITVVRTTKPSLAGSVEFYATGLTAIDGKHFVATNGVLNFAAGQMTNSFTVQLLDDAEPERNQSVLLVLTNGSPTMDLSGLTAATLWIQDNDRVVQLTQAAYQVSETNGFAIIGVNRVGGESGQVSVEYYTTDGTATAPMDYYAVSGTLTFFDGEVFKVIVVPIINDTLLEGAEIFTLTLTNALTATLGAPNEATVTILDDEAVYGLIYYTNRNAITVLDASSALPYPSTITVGNLTGVLSHVSVALDGFTHSYPSDVDVLLVGPLGQTVLLMSSAGANYRVAGATLGFDDAARTLLPQTTPIVSGTNQPTAYGPERVFYSPAPAGPYSSALSVFTGSTPNGTWSLFVQDHRGGDAGVISNGWRLTLTTVDPATATDLTAGLAADSSSLPAGQWLTYTASVTNNGPSAASGVRLIDVLPEGFTRATLTPSQGTCTNDNGVVICDFGHLAVGAGATVQIKGIPTLIGRLDNQVTVSANQPDLLEANNTASVVTFVDAGMTADLWVTISGQPNPVLAGQPLTYAVRVYNYGPNDASGVVLTNWLPAGAALVSIVANNSYTANGPELVFTIGNLARAQSANFTLVVQPLAAGRVTNSAVAVANEPYGFPVNTATNVTTVSPAADLAVTIQDTADPVAVGAQVGYVINVVNHGPMAAHGVTVFYNVPASLSLQSYTVTQGSNYLAPPMLVWVLGNLPAGQGATLTATAQTGGPGTLTNQVSVIGVEADPNPANSTAAESTTVLATLTPPPAGVINNGIVELGVTTFGSLSVPWTVPSSGTGTTNVGLRFLPNGAEGASTNEGWGVADRISNLSGWADRGFGLAHGLVSESFTADSQTATAVARVVDGASGRSLFRVVHAYYPSATPNLYQVDVMITNISSSQVQMLYRRVMDWEIEPTASQEYVTIVKGNSPNLIYTSNGEQGTSDPLSARADRGATGTFVNQGPAEQGAWFDFDFGLVPPGEARRFTMYYGAAGTKAEAVQALTTVGAEAYSLGQPSTPDGPTLGAPNTFIIGFGGIGGSLLAGADLSVAQSVSPNAIAVGAPLTYSISVSNRGPERAAAVVLSDTLPAGVSLLSVTPSQGSWTLNGSLLVLNAGDLPAGGQASLTVVVTSAQAGLLTNSVSVASGSIDGRPGNNTSSLVTTVLPAGAFANADLIRIIDAAPAIPYPSLIHIEGATGVVKVATVTLTDISHTFSADIRVLLTGPAGQNVVLMSGAGYNHPLSGVTLTFDDAASGPLPDNAQIVAGTYQPTDLAGGNAEFATPAPAGPYGTGLSGFKETDPNGDWRLWVLDSRGGDEGVIAGGWRLNLAIGAPEPPRLVYVRAGAQLMIAWPDIPTTVGFVLERGATLLPGDWQAVSPAPTPADGWYTYTADLTSGFEFYRLRKP